MKGYSQNAKLKDYALSITKPKVVKEGTTTFWVVPVTLTNNSTDTLKYYTWSCSWPKYYRVSNPKLNIDFKGCDKNYPYVMKLAPGVSNKKELRLVIPQTLDATKINFKIGLTIIKEQVFIDQYDREHYFKDPNNMIWSNEISMK